MSRNRSTVYGHTLLLHNGYVHVKAHLYLYVFSSQRVRCVRRYVRTYVRTRYSHTHTHSTTYVRTYVHSFGSWFKHVLPRSIVILYRKVLYIYNTNTISICLKQCCFLAMPSLLRQMDRQSLRYMSKPNTPMISTIKPQSGFLASCLRDHPGQTLLLLVYLKIWGGGGLVGGIGGLSYFSFRYFKIWWGGGLVGGIGGRRRWCRVNTACPSTRCGRSLSCSWCWMLKKWCNSVDASRNKRKGETN